MGVATRCHPFSVLDGKRCLISNRWIPNCLPFPAIAATMYSCCRRFLRCSMLAYLFVLLAIGVRFLIAMGQTSFHFTPVGAALLFFGAKRSRKEMWIPVLLLAATDLAL